jgi:predicted nuclease of predicted toxin-antitoxin system
MKTEAVIRDYNIQKATDLEVFARAAEEDRILISADTNFGTFLDLNHNRLGVAEATG